MATVRMIDDDREAAGLARQYLPATRIESICKAKGWLVGVSEPFICTRPAGHDGPHVAHGQERVNPRIVACAIWSC